MSRFLRWLRKLLGGGASGAGSFSVDAVFQRHQRAYVSAINIVHLFYVVSLYATARITGLGWPTWIDREAISPLWPLRWAADWNLLQLTNAVMVLLMLTAFLVAVQPWRRLFRLLFFLSFFLFATYSNSFGKISHGWHAWTFVALMFVLLPTWKRGGTPSITQRQQFLVIIFATQALTLLFYSMSGAWKMYAAVVQMWAGQVHAFHPYALAYLTADRLLQTTSWSLLGPTLVKYPLLGWPLHVSAIYLELFSFVAAFRPALHRFWGASLILFHLGTILILSIAFPPSIFLLGLLFLMSPFAPTDISVRDVIANLPIAGLLWRLISSKSEAT